MLKLRGLLACLLLLVVLAMPAGAEQLQKNFSHSLSVGTAAKSFEHRIDLPENWAAEGKYFIGRNLKLDGKLVIEREELSKTYYYVKVRLPKAALWFAKGSIDITLTAEKNPVSQPEPVVPDNLKVSGGYYPNFSWNGNADYSAISLLERSNGKTLWERVLIDSHKCTLDEGSVRIGGKYTWAVKQANESGKYSAEARCDFRVDARQERCRQCFGSGYITCRTCRGSGHIVSNGPNNTPVTKICYHCNGTGRERCIDCNGHGYLTVPSIVQESRQDENFVCGSEAAGARTIIEGTIRSIELDQQTPDLQGKITISGQNEEKTFLVSKYTLILIIINDKARVTELRHLKPGWKCSLAYDLAEEDEISDLTENCGSEVIKFADNMMVYHP